MPQISEKNEKLRSLHHKKDKQKRILHIIAYLHFISIKQRKLRRRRSSITSCFLILAYSVYQETIEYIEQIASERYFTRSKKYKSHNNEVEKFTKEALQTGNEAKYSNRQFKEHFRMTRYEFKKIHQLISNHFVFRLKKTGRKQPSSKFQLLCFLKYVGLYGNGGGVSLIRQFCGNISFSLLYASLRRVRFAINAHYDRIVFWPGNDERLEIAARIRAKYFFKKCVGVIDGTLFPFAMKPGINGEDYFCRKSIYALHSLITCDDAGRIRDMVLGWPGSVHDNRVWRNSLLNSREFFSLGEYLLGDSAFEPCSIMVPSFKKPNNRALPKDEEFFNTVLAKIRIRSEHCIGMLKGRFQFLKGIRMQLRDL